MGTRISTGAQNSQADNFGAHFDSGILEIRSGAAPAESRDAPTGVVLGAINLPADCLGAAVAGLISKLGTWQDASADAGSPTVATWARFKQVGDLGTQNDTDIRCDVDIGLTGSGATMELDNTSIAVGQQITVTAFTFQQPDS